MHAAGRALWSPDFRDLDAQKVAQARKLGLRVIAWTVNEPDEIRRMLALNLDGIISDYPDRVRAALKGDVANDAGHAGVAVREHRRVPAAKLGGMLRLDAFALWPPGGFESNFAPWQLVTYAFLHGGLTHIFFNMLGLYMFGSEIERLFGSRFYAAYYFGCVVSAALCHLAVTAFMGGAAACRWWALPAAFTGCCSPSAFISRTVACCC